MTVREFIEKLKQMPQDSQVRAGGCAWACAIVDVYESLGCKKGTDEPIPTVSISTQLDDRNH